MKYYSEKLQKLFDTKEACEQAEFAAKEEENREKIRKERAAAEQKAQLEARNANRKAAAERVDKARQAMKEAQKAYKIELENFIKEYGTYHYSTSSFEDTPLLFDFFNRII